MERVKTGISQLDEILHGGFLRGDSIMLGGPAGAGKTSLGLQFLVNGATKFGENGIFVTFEQLPDQLYRDEKFRMGLAETGRRRQNPSGMYIAQTAGWG